MRGTDNQHYRVFHGFLGRECLFTVKAAEEMERVLGGIFRRDLARQESMTMTNDFWYSVDAFLMATGNISKAFFPASPRKTSKLEKDSVEKRGKELRQMLGIGSESPFKKENRKLRDHFEHYDECASRWFDPDSWTLHYLDDKLDLREMLQAVRKPQQSLEDHPPS